MRCLIRSDGDSRMGTGHLLRCLALAQAWREGGGSVTFRSACTVPGLLARLSDSGAEVQAAEGDPGSPEDADRTREAARRLGARWLVLDGYHFSDEFQRRVRGEGEGEDEGESESEGFRLLVLDDYGHAAHSRADLVLNQNLHASEELYPDRGPSTRLLLGPRFALLRREFWMGPGEERTVPEVGRKVLVSLGGSDPENATLKVVQALDRVGVPGLEALVVLGAANPHRGSIEAAARQATAKVELRVDVADMSALMAWADVAVAAGGTTTWERARMGLPSLVLVLAENQRPLAEASEAEGIGRDLGTASALDVSALARSLEQLLRDRGGRAAMARRGPEIVDGQGARRVCRQLWEGLVTLRPAQAGDCRQVWEWANDPTTRAVSFSPDPIPWETHQDWFAARLNDPGCAFFIALDGAREAPIGQVRFDRHEDGAEAVISIALDGRCRGHGYGPVVIRRGSLEAFRRWPVEHVLALVREGNPASYRAFLKAGFRPAGTATVRGEPAHRLALRRDEAWLAS